MKILAMALVTILVSSCSHVQYQNSDVLKRNNEIAELKNGLDQAEAADVAALSPTHFAEAKSKLNSALAQAQKSSDVDAGKKTAQEGLAKLAEANRVATSGRQILAGTIAARESAIEARADELLTRDFNDADKSFERAGRLLERNELNDAREQNVKLQKTYAELEVKAMKAGLNNYAKSAYEQAIKDGADKYAPLTLAKAKKELELAQKIIDVEKKDYQSAKNHAEAARYLATQASGIAHVVADMKKSDLTREQMVLWYQKQLADVHQPILEPLSFDKENADIVKGFRDEIAGLLAYNQELQERGIACEKNIAGLKGTISKDASEAERERLLRLQKDESFRSLSAMFDKSEAQVLLSDEDIIIRSYGFNFQVGKSEILSKNYSLLNKIVTAILRFPHSAIVIEGHTDSTGSKARNLKLSKERAQNISNYLVQVAGLDPNRITSVGYGDSRPIEKNDSPEGRAKNRRIEVLIKRPK
jgi:OOP family OmpA-OmpF porin